MEGYIDRVTVGATTKQANDNISYAKKYKCDYNNQFFGLSEVGTQTDLTLLDFETNNNIHINYNKNDCNNIFDMIKNNTLNKDKLFVKQKRDRSKSQKRIKETIYKKKK